MLVSERKARRKGRKVKKEETRKGEELGRKGREKQIHDTEEKSKVTM